MNLDGKKKIVGTCIGRTGLWESLKGELGCGNLFSVCLLVCLFFLFVLLVCFQERIRFDSP